MGSATVGIAHPERKEITHYLLSRGLDPVQLAPAPARIEQLLAAALPIYCPHGLAPQLAPVDPAPLPDDTLPRADVVIITWTVDELAGPAQVFTPGVSPQRWHRYTRHFADYQHKIRPHAPAATSRRLGSYLPTPASATPPSCASSPSCTSNQDGIKPVKARRAAGQGLASPDHR
jgi:hypothetical protein